MASNTIEMAESEVVSVALPIKGRPRVQTGDEKDFKRRAKRRRYYQRNKFEINRKRRELMKGPKGDRIREHNRRAAAKLRNRPAWQRWRVSYYDKNRQRILELARQRREAVKVLEEDESQREWCKYVEERERAEKLEALRQKEEVVVQDSAREDWRVVWNRVVESIKRLPMLLSLGRSVWCDDVSVHTEFRRAVLAMTKENPKNMMRVWMTEGMISPRARLGYWRGRELLNGMSIAHITDLYAFFPYPKCMMRPGHVPAHCLRFLPELQNEADAMFFGQSDGEDSANESFEDTASDSEDKKLISDISDEEVEEALKEMELEMVKRTHQVKWQKVMAELTEFMSLPFTVQNAVMARHRRHRKPVKPGEFLESLVFMPIAASEREALEKAKSEHRVKWKKVMASLLELVVAPFNSPKMIAPCRRPYRRHRSAGRPHGQAYRNVAEYVAEMWYNTGGD